MSVAWGTMSDVEEESPDTTEVAESTTADPLSAPEGSEATGEKTGDKIAQPAAEKPAADAAKPDELAEHAKTLSGKNAERFNELLAQRAQAREGETRSKEVVDSFAKEGIASVEDLRFVVQQGREAIAARAADSEAFTNNPVGYAEKLQQQNPQAWQSLSTSMLQAAWLRETQTFEQAFLKSGDKLDQDAAQFCRERAAAMAGGPPQPDAARGRMAELQTREREFQAQQEAVWKGSIEREVFSELTKRIDKFTNGVQFTGEEQKNRFMREVRNRIHQTFETRKAFTDRVLEGARQQNGNPQHRTTTAKAYGDEIESRGVLEGIISEELGFLSLAAGSAEKVRLDTLAKANGRREVVDAGGGNRSNGAESQKAGIFKQIDEDSSLSPDEKLDARMTWKLRVR